MKSATRMPTVKIRARRGGSQTRPYRTVQIPPQNSP
jgi:hypothetical protein